MGSVVIVFGWLLYLCGMGELFKFDNCVICLVSV